MKPERGQKWKHNISGMEIEIWDVVERITPKKQTQTYDVYPAGWNRDQHMSKRSWELWSDNARIVG